MYLKKANRLFMKLYSSKTSSRTDSVGLKTTQLATKNGLIIKVLSEILFIEKLEHLMYLSCRNN
jgi:hypothetical protein